MIHHQFAVHHYVRYNPYTGIYKTKNLTVPNQSNTTDEKLITNKIPNIGWYREFTQGMLWCVSLRLCYKTPKYTLSG